VRARTIPASTAYEAVFDGMRVFPSLDMSCAMSVFIVWTLYNSNNFDSLQHRQHRVSTFEQVTG